MRMFLSLFFNPISKNMNNNLTVSELQAVCHGNAVAAGWYTDLATGLPKVMNKGERFMLMVSEISEAMEGARKNLMDDKLPHRKMEEVEMADCVIRILDFCGAEGYDLEGAIIEKLAYNQHRPDHKKENRVLEGGKAF